MIFPSDVEDVKTSLAVKLAQQKSLNFICCRKLFVRKVNKRTFRRKGKEKITRKTIRKKANKIWYNFIVQILQSDYFNEKPVYFFCTLLLLFLSTVKWKFQSNFYNFAQECVTSIHDIDNEILSFVFIVTFSALVYHDVCWYMRQSHFV